jgi:hypothetical protein
VGIVVSLCDTTKAFSIWDPEEKKMKISRDVCIDELANLTDVSSSAPVDIRTFEQDGGKRTLMQGLPWL